MKYSFKYTNKKTNLNFKWWNFKETIHFKGCGFNVKLQVSSDDYLLS